MVPIDTTPETPQHAPTAGALAGALSAESSSVRLQAALAAGSYPDPALVDPLVERCAVEPELFVRDTLSWALMRLPVGTTLPRLRRELGSEQPQARRQALHTLSKIGDRSTYPWITRGMLCEADEGIARTAWRVAVALVPEDEGEKSALADVLVTQLGRGDRDARLSMSRALVDLGQAAAPAVRRATTSSDPAAAARARAVLLLLEDLEAASAIDDGQATA